MEENPVIPKLKLLLIGGSAGSLEVLLKILPALSPELQLAIVIVLHRKNSDDSTLEELLSMKSVLPVREAADKTVLLGGSIYVAPADYHLLFENDGLLSLDASEKVNYSRPSIDVVFESAAEAYRESACAILLSGSNADGTDGLRAIKESAGIAVVQSPASAEMPFMPQSAINAVPVDFILRPDEMAAFINRF